jgi:hypothetical protein
MGELRDERDVGRAAVVVRQVLDWAASSRWHSITVAAGAMPESLSAFPKNVATEARRWDAVFWQQLNEYGVVDYGDYGIAHPRMPGKMPRGPLPNLRYTASGRWWIYRWQSDETGGHGAFYDLCRTLVASEHWPSHGGDFSWGDGELASRASGIGGPGNATNWRAWGTSHHIAHVIRHLASSGVP